MTFTVSPPMQSRISNSFASTCVWPLGLLANRDKARTRFTAWATKPSDTDSRRGICPQGPLQLQVNQPADEETQIKIARKILGE